MGQNRRRPAADESAVFSRDRQFEAGPPGDYSASGADFSQQPRKRGTTLFVIAKRPRPGRIRQLFPDIIPRTFVAFR
jgi:hypothetical protein